MRGTATHTRYSYMYAGTAAPTRYSCAHEEQLHLRGTAAPTRYTYTYEVQLYLQGTVAFARYSCTNEVQMYLRGTGTLKKNSYYTYEIQLYLRGTDALTVCSKAAPKRYCCTEEAQPQSHLLGTTTSTRYSYCTSTRFNYTYEVQLHLQDTARPTGYSYTFIIAPTPTVHWKRRIK
jgi:hypothetical protein